MLPRPVAAQDPSKQQKQATAHRNCPGIGAGTNAPIGAQRQTLGTVRVEGDARSARTAGRVLGLNGAAWGRACAVRGAARRSCPGATPWLNDDCRPGAASWARGGRRAFGRWWVVPWCGTGTPPDLLRHPRSAARRGRGSQSDVGARNAGGNIASRLKTAKSYQENSKPACTARFFLP